MPYSTGLKKMIKTLLFTCLLTITLTGCVSSGGKVTYYSLFAEPITGIANDSVAVSPTLSIGVAPVVLPEYLDNAAIVSFTQGQQLRISGSRAWAGSLDAAVLRVVTGNLSAALQLEQVWAFPWDTRSRPDYQLQINLEEFAGVLGGDVRLQARWKLLSQKGDTVVMSGLEKVTQTSENDSYDAYVKNLNNLLTEVTLQIAKKIIITI